jgi:hypothetical protein
MTNDQKMRLDRTRDKLSRRENLSYAMEIGHFGIRHWVFVRHYSFDIRHFEVPSQQ